VKWSDLHTTGKGVSAADQREVHVWFVELAEGGSALEACSSILSGDERERASRFRFERLQTGFTLSRGILRTLLARYLGTEAGRIRFAYGPRGKPAVAFPQNALGFNMAHSGRLAAYAFAEGCELGVDIEEVRPVMEQEDIVKRFFAPEECAEWLGCEAAERDQAFFRCWTRKEAYIKALGDGLSLPLDSFRVSFGPGVAASRVRATRDVPAVGDWYLHPLTPAEGYTGALAVLGRARRVRILPCSTAAAVLGLASAPGPFPPGRRTVPVKV